MSTIPDFRENGAEDLRSQEVVENHQAFTTSSLMEEVLSKFSQLNHEASFSARMLRGSYEAQRDIVNSIKSLHERPTLTMKDADSIILTWLHCCYLHVSSLPSFSTGTIPLAPLVAATGLLQPFINIEAGVLNIGTPSNTEETADNLSELLRLAGAALVTYHDYLSVTPPPGAPPRDEASLLYATMTIKSLNKPAGTPSIKVMEAMLVEAKEALLHSSVVESISVSTVRGLESIEKEPESQNSDPVGSSGSSVTRSEVEAVAHISSFGLSELRWLMHWLRSQLSRHFAAVRQILGDEEGHSSNMVAAQQDQLCMLKLVPGSPASFVLYCRACLEFQQYKAAHIFAGKGLTVSHALKDDSHLATLLVIHATAAALGGGGPNFNSAEVKDAYVTALNLKQDTMSWLPGVYKDLNPVTLEPECSFLQEHVLKKSGGGGELCVDDEILLPALQMLYPVPEATSVPPGAVVLQEGEEDKEGGDIEDHHVGGLPIIQERQSKNVGGARRRGGSVVGSRQEAPSRTGRRKH
ncbi:hypothetical protein CEUSTIGMA_g5062.t1 [Chlamydomonas eustigma]|uniref:Uncharacterized protein n=1 Tax=Chlamydomonas eustigma TaxID=1157962 RepID=A0A250X3G7_9CHLO|nr:hypothetical protein CEUSTIGMA_g5062.t1 [Chlamydomonas eustigma]|eukprot:GAX77618.1 hypothetical protein CEUSTIGMA_g5062.t1 [Chlamydomonas eustigma]